MHAITSVASGDIVVGGDFSRVGGQTIDDIDALDPVTGQSLSWSFPSSGEVIGLVTGPDDNVYGAIGGFRRQGALVDQHGDLAMDRLHRR